MLQTFVATGKATLLLVSMAFVVSCLLGGANWSLVKQATATSINIWKHRYPFHGGYGYGYPYWGGYGGYGGYGGGGYGGIGIGLGR